MTDETEYDSVRSDSQYDTLTDGEPTFDYEKARQGVRLGLEAMGEDPERDRVAMAVRNGGGLQ